MKTQREEGHLQAKEKGLRRQADLGLPTSRTVRRDLCCLRPGPRTWLRQPEQTDAAPLITKCAVVRAASERVSPAGAQGPGLVRAFCSSHALLFPSSNSS